MVARYDTAMHILDIFRDHPTKFSFEFFPPKTDEAGEDLFRNIASLQELKPSFVSVTYGAGGSTRDRTHDLILRIQSQTKLTAVSHLTCVCHCLLPNDFLQDDFDPWSVVELILELVFLRQA